jgi:hypothetical protein
MALELAMSLERRFGTHMPLAGSTGTKSIAEIADEITDFVAGAQDREDSVVATLAEQHHDEIAADQTEALKQIVSETQRTKRLLS